MRRATSRKSFALLNVTMPENEIMKPIDIAASATSRVPVKQSRRAAAAFSSRMSLSVSAEALRVWIDQARSTRGADVSAKTLALPIQRLGAIDSNRVRSRRCPPLSDARPWRPTADRDSRSSTRSSGCTPAVHQTFSCVSPPAHGREGLERGRYGQRG